MYVKLFFLLLVGRTTASPYVQIEVEELPEIDEYPEEHGGYYQGDIRLKEQRNAINTHTFPSAIWPHGVVPYVIESSYSSSVRNTFLAAMEEIKHDTMVHGKTCVSYVPKNSSHHDYIEIVPQKGLLSIGKFRIARASSANMSGAKGDNLYRFICLDYKITEGHHTGRGFVSLGHGCERKGTVMHELLHVLGFFHEQERYDRDFYVHINFDNIDSSRQKDFSKQSTHTMDTLGVGYDYSSIMHYASYAFAMDPSTPTIVPTHDPTAVIGQRLGLSRKDVEKIQLLYGCGTDLSHVATPSTPHHIVDCSFEHDTCNLVQDHSDNFDWVRHRGAGPTPGTGPNADHTNGAGYYLVAQAKHHHNRVARIKSPNLPAGSTCIDISVFVHGSGVRSLKFLASGYHIHTQTIRTFSGSQTNGWKKMFFNINVPRDWTFVIEADIGGNDLGDIAIDDLIIYSGRCQTI